MSRKTRPGSETGMSFTLANYSQSQSQQDKKNGVQDKRLYFVIPDNLTKETCSKRLQNAYRLSQDYELQAEWVTAKDLFITKPQPGNVFVCDPFGGRVYDFLHSSFFESKVAKKFLIIGPMCLEYVINRKEVNAAIETKGFPFYTVAMKDECITLTGFNTEDQEELTDLIQKMNGVVIRALAMSTTHVVASNVLTPKCCEAYKRDIPVMTADWVHALWEESKKELVNSSDRKYGKFKCGVFHNVNICVSQIPSAVKSIIQKTITDGGGIFTKDFKRNVSQVLVVPSSSGDKYKYAQTWKVPCVTPAWIEKCKEQGHLVPFDEFQPTDSEASRNHPIMSSTQIDGGIHPKSLPGGDVSVISLINKNDEFVTSVSNSTRCSNTSAISAMSHVDRESEIPGDPWEVIDHAPKGFLDQFKVYICDFKQPRKLDNLRYVINESGATCYVSLNNRVTHVIMVDEMISDQEKNYILKMSQRPFILPLLWLASCAHHGSPIDETNFKILLAPELDPRNEELGESSGASKRNSKENGLKRNKSVFEAPESVPNDDNTLKASAVTNSHATGEDGKVLFDGLRFCVQLESDQEKERIISIIRSYSGEIIDCKDAKQSEIDIMIATPVYDAREINPLQVFTKFWLSDVVDRNSLEIPDEPYHTPHPFTEAMLNLFQGVVIAVSAYPDKTKEYIRQMSIALGATVQEVFAKKSTNNTLRTTHLICGVTDNKKYKASRRWGIPAVTLGWIVESCKHGEKLDLVDFLLDNEDNSDTTTVYALTPNTQGKLRDLEAARLGKKNPMQDDVFKTPAVAAILAQEITKSSTRTPDTPSGPPPPESPLLHPALSREASRALKEQMERACATPPAYLQRVKRRPSTPFMEIVRSCQEMCDKKIAEIVAKEKAERALEPPLDPKYEERRWVVTPTQTPERVPNGTNDGSKESERSCGSRKRGQESSTDEEELVIHKKRHKNHIDSSPNGRKENDINSPVVIRHTRGSSRESQARSNRYKFESFEDIHPDEEPAENVAEVYWADEPIDQETNEETASETNMVHNAEDEGVLAEATGGNYSVEERESHTVDEEIVPQRFAISGASANEKVALKNTLEALGATVSLQDNFDITCDAIIAYKVTRSEKILGAIASGKPLVHVAYIKSCEEHKTLLKVDEYLWTEELGNSVPEKNMARLAKQWYNKIKDDAENKPYFGLSVWLCEQKMTRREAYTRLIEAGGGRIATSVEDANIVIGDGAEAADIGEEKNIPVKLPMYLNDVILQVED